MMLGVVSQAPCPAHRPSSSRCRWVSTIHHLAATTLCVHISCRGCGANFPEIHKREKKNKMKKMKKLQVKVWVQNKTRYNDVNIQTNVKNKTKQHHQLIINIF